MTDAEPRPLSAPRDGVPPVLVTPDALAAAAEELAAGTGPVAVDAERASGYRYSGRAYLVQLRREGAGSYLIDPIPLPDLSIITDALGEAEWVLHAASQDLACLAEVKLTPGGDLFDTELGARLAGFARVGLRAITEELLGYQLAKEHSAADWSVRPLRPEWLTYATLDVELLVPLRDKVAQSLAEQGKTEWARQEFAAVRDAPAPPPRTDPWRRTSGSHALRNPRQLAVLRELWQTRDAVARRRDIAPGRILPDRALVDASEQLPPNADALIRLPVFSGPANRRQADLWFGAISRGLALPDAQLPPQHLPATGPPPPKVWGKRNPIAARRLVLAKEVVAAYSDQLRVPLENLLTPDLLRRQSWETPDPITCEAVAHGLQSMGARRWQTDLLAEPLTQAYLRAMAPVEVPLEQVEDA